MHKHFNYNVYVTKGYTVFTCVSKVQFDDELLFLVLFLSLYLVNHGPQNVHWQRKGRKKGSCFNLPRYLGMLLRDQNCMLKQIRSGLYSGNACYHSVHHLLSSDLLSKNTKTKIYRTRVLPVVLCVWV